VEGSATTFEQLGLSASSLEAIRQAGFEAPTPIQVGVIPIALAGEDVIGQARTVTGKTASFFLPLFERIKFEAAESETESERSDSQESASAESASAGDEKPGDEKPAGGRRRRRRYFSRAIVRYSS